MDYRALACDYDGTLAHDGRVSSATVVALRRWKESGRKLILITGRELKDLFLIFKEIDMFDELVVENGAVLYRPFDQKIRLLAEGPSESFVRTLQARGVTPLSIGHVIVATFHPHEQTVLDTIRDLGLELQIIFNKGSVMVLPTGVNKASGLTAVLQEMGLAPQEVAAIGDAENDHAFLSLCGLSAAVANALPAVKDRVNVVTRGDHGNGVIELIDQLIAAQGSGK